MEDEAESVPEEATLADLARFLSAEKDDDEAEALTAIQRRLGNDVNRDDVLPPRVRVMTMHGAKGLSAHVVFIPGLEEEILPRAARREYVGQVYEAARMLFVSITRARLVCVASFAEHRLVNGQYTSVTPSRFTSHLGKPFETRTGGTTAEVAAKAVALSGNL
ncbi:MAG: 3'-5' exonuclease [Thermoleophilaceae bacterium]